MRAIQPPRESVKKKVKQMGTPATATSVRHTGATRRSAASARTTISPMIIISASTFQYPMGLSSLAYVCAWVTTSGRTLPR